MADTSQSFLTVDDCFDLGRVAYLDGDYYHTELWMLQALRQLEQGETPGAVDVVMILDHLSYSVYQQGELERALDFTKKLLELGQWLETQPVTTGVEFRAFSWTPFASA